MPRAHRSGVRDALPSPDGRRVLTRRPFSPASSSRKEPRPMSTNDLPQIKIAVIGYGSQGAPMR